MIRKKLFAFMAIIYLSILRVLGVQLTLYEDNDCQGPFITKDLEGDDYMPEGTPREGYWSLRVNNPFEGTLIFVNRHHFCSFYGGQKKRNKKQPRDAAVLWVPAGETRCYDVSEFGQNYGTTIIKSACINNPNRLRPGDTEPPEGMGPTLPAYQSLSAIERLPPHLLPDLAAMGLQDIIAYLHPTESSRNVLSLPESPRDSSPELQLDQWLWQDTDTLGLSPPSMDLVEDSSSSSVSESTSSSTTTVNSSTTATGTCSSSSKTHTSSSTSHSSYQSLPGYETMEHERTSSGPRPTGKSMKISKSHVNSGKAHSFGTRKKSSWDKVYISFREIRLIQDQASWFISTLVSHWLKMVYWGVGLSLIFSAIRHRALIDQAIIRNRALIFHDIVTSIQEATRDIAAIHNQQMGNQNRAIQSTPSTNQPMTNRDPLMIKNKAE